MASRLYQEFLVQLNVCHECVKLHPKGTVSTKECKTPDQFCLMSSAYSTFSRNTRLASREVSFGGPSAGDLEE